jgi:uncharacterized membrane protein
MENIALNKEVELKASLEWIKKSFYTFREQPLQFIVLGIIGTLSSIVPLWGAFISPIFTAHFALLTDKLHQGKFTKFTEIFKGFFDKPLVIRLAFLSFCFNASIFLLQYLIENKVLQNNQSNYLEIGSFSISWLLLFLFPVLLLQMALWLSPVICLKHPEIKPLRAMWLSIKVGFYNVPTLLLYFLIVLTFTILAIIPIGLGLLIWMPILNITSFYIYKSAFVAVK